MQLKLLFHQRNTTTSGKEHIVMEKPDYPTPPGFEEYILSTNQAYIGIIPLGVFSAIIGVIFYALHGKIAFLTGYNLVFSWQFFLPMFISGIIVHELIHAFAWKLASGHGWETMKFGIMWKQLMPFAHCTKPMNARAYRIGAAMPGILLGIIPLVGSLFFSNATLFWFGVIFFTAASGDAGILYRLRNVAAECLVQDHPNKPGCLVQSPFRV